MQNVPAIRQICTQIYQNEYNKRGELIKIQMETIVENLYGIETKYNEKKYFYDNKDRLYQIIEYDIETIGQPGKISSIERFTSLENEKIRYREYPNDTSLSILSKYNNSGYETEIYIKDKLPDIDSNNFEISENKKLFSYNESDQLIITKNIDLIKKTEKIQKFEYHSIGDTVFVESFIDNDLQFKSKRFSSNLYQVEVIEYFSPHNTDSIYSLNHKVVKSVNYDDYNKRTYEIEYDEHGNETKHIEIVFDI
jgi:hypothetical protein